MITTQLHNYNPRSKQNLKTTYLPERAFKLLKTLRDDYDFLVGAPSQRPMEHYMRIHGVTERTIGSDFNYLENLGLCKSLPGGRGNARKRWITCEGYSYLVNYASGYTSGYNSSIPYIDLSEKEVIDYKIPEEQQICGQNIEHIQDIDEKLDVFLEQERTAPKEREEIKKAIRASRIGPVRKEELINRVITANKKKRIHDKKSYVLTCIHNERGELQEIFNVLRDKNVSVNLYAQP